MCWIKGATLRDRLELESISPPTMIDINHVEFTLIHACISSTIAWGNGRLVAKFRSF